MQEHQQEEVDALEQVAGDLRVEKKWYRQPRLLVLLFLTLVATLLLFAAINSARTPALGGGNTASSTEPFHSIPPTKEDFALTTAEFNQRVSELGQTAFGGEGTGALNPLGSTDASASGSPVQEPLRRPDGPPPLFPPVR